ncbi:hypothetical protein BN1708_003009, partial [Verticillium longisporum]
VTAPGAASERPAAHAAQDRSKTWILHQTPIATEAITSRLISISNKIGILHARSSFTSMHLSEENYEAAADDSGDHPPLHLASQAEEVISKRVSGTPK